MLVIKKTGLIAAAAFLLFALALFVNVQTAYAEEVSDGVLTYTLNDDGTATVRGFDDGLSASEKTAVEIPKTVNFGTGTDYTVTGFYSEAFKADPDINYFFIPSTIKTIDDYVFLRSSLSQIEFESGSQLESIGFQAFGECPLKAIRVPASVKTIDGQAFEKCGNLSIVSFPEDSQLESIVKYAFMESSLPRITIPANMKKIDSFAFSEAGSLRTVIFAEGTQLEQIEDNAFRECTSLSNITLPEGLQYIGSNAFVGTAISEITIPSSVNRIEDCAFYTSPIDKITFASGSLAEKIGVNAFAGGRVSEFTLPPRLKEIGNNRIYWSDDAAAHYLGTREQYDNSGFEGWQYGYPAPADFLHCVGEGEISGTVTKATPDADGTIVYTCAKCTDWSYTDIIYRPDEIQLEYDTVPYTGTAYEPQVTVKDTLGETINDANYDVSYSNNVNAGTATVTVTFKGDHYDSTLSQGFTITPLSIAGATVSGAAGKTYTGKALIQNPVVKLGSKTLKKGTDYTLSYKGNVNVGTAVMTVKGKGNYTKSTSAKFTIKKAANTLKVKGRTATVKYSAVKKKAQALGVTKVIQFTNKGKGTKTYAKSSGNAKISIAKSTGKVTVKKGLKKGTYKVKVKVTAKGNANYKPLTKSVTFTIKVK